MNKKSVEMHRALVLLAKQKIGFEVCVHGISMYPTLVDGEVVTAKQMPQYMRGDIVVFKYHNQTNLIHRIVGVDITSDRYMCKGDNAYNYEIIYGHQIIGKVTKCKHNTLINWPAYLIELSLKAGLAYRKGNLDISAIVTTKEYVEYRRNFELYTANHLLP